MLHVDIRKGDKKYLGSFEMWCTRGMEVSLRNEEELRKVTEERNVLFTIRKMKAN